MATVVSKSQLRALNKLISRKRELQRQVAEGNPTEVAQAQRDLKQLGTWGNEFADYRRT